MVIQNADPAEANASAEPPAEVNPDAVVRTQTDENRGRGQTKIRARVGHAFRSNLEGVDFDVTADGVYVSAEQAKAIMTEANDAYGDGFVSIVEDDADDEG